MGGEFIAEGPPRFLAAALADAGTDARPGVGLERLQIVKGWVEDRQGHTAVFDVAGTPLDGADPTTCALPEEGTSSLCTVWTDPEWVEGQRAVYYLRVLEEPTCRWSTAQCLALPAEERPASCSDAAIPDLVRERAWSSPIWVE